jgi:acyl-CoA thioester hydrolase
MGELNTSVYQTEMQVRPDDLDMFRHVHSSRYIDYVLAARFHQMEHFYKMPMQEFLANNLGWVIRQTTINYKRALTLGDMFTVKTHIVSIEKTDVEVNFEIVNTRQKVCCDGTFLYTLISTSSNRAEIIPDWIVDRFSN